MNSLMIIDGAINVLSSPGRWMKGHLAKDTDGCVTNSNDPKAACWCLMGAVEKARGPLDDLSGSEQIIIEDEVEIIYDRLHEVVREFYPFRGRDGFISFNDHEDTTYAEVVRVLSVTRERLDQ